MTTNEPRGRPTMLDVAAAAGVGLKSVSRVINGEKVRPATLDAVQAAVESLGYRRNDSAALLRSGRSSTVGLIVNDMSEAFQLRLATSIEDALAEKGYRLVVASTRGEHAREVAAFHSLSAQGVDGLIVLPTLGDQGYMRPELDLGLALVLVDRPPAGPEVDAVLSTNYEGSRSATDLLIANGHRRIGYFTLETELHTGAERLRGHLASLASHGIPEDAGLVAHWPNGRDEVLAEVDRMMAMDDPPTAFLAAISRLAKHLVWAFRRRGISPSLIAYDDFELADLLEPPLSVVSQDAQAMGREAARLLLLRISGHGGPPRRIEVPTRLIERDSVRPRHMPAR